jgi:hypothetical protein
MKKTSLYIFPILAAALFASCSEGLDNVGGQPSDGDFVIDLSVQCAKGVSTRVDAEQWPGLDKYNENTVAYVDWYIFKSSEDTEDALLSGRENITQEEDETTGLATTDLKVVELDMGDVVSDSQRSFYVYTIANMPDVTHDEMGTTLAELKDLVLKSEFNVNPFSAQESFVMTAGQGFTFTDTDKGKLKVITNKLSRLSSKVTINMNVIPAIDQLKTLSNGNRDYVRTWYPVLENVEVYLSFANQETKISADPVPYNQDGFFTYNRAAFKPAYSYPGLEGDPVETIPSSVTPDWNDNSWKWNVTGTPFYSYPMNWTTDSPQAPFIKVILPWVAYEETATYETTEEGGRTFKSATRNKSGSFLSQEFYYKIPLPGTELKANDWFDLSFDVEILGSTSDELPIDLAGRYCVVDWSDPNIQAGGELKQGRYLSTASDTLYIYGADSLEVPVISSHALATGASVVTKREVYYNGTWVNATNSTATGSSINQLRNLRTRGLDVYASEDGHSAITFKDKLNATINDQLDCFPMRFTLHLSHSDGNGPTKDIVIVQYPSIHISSKPGGSAMVDGYYGNVGNRYRRRDNYPSYDYYHNGTLRENNSGNDLNGNVRVPYGRIARYVNSQLSLTVLTITSFDASSKKYTISGNEREYMIADPRQASGYSTANYNTTYPLNDRRRPLVPYYDGTRNVEWNEAAAKIMIGSRTTPNFIAPKIIIASRWSRMVASDGTAENGYDAMERRCATYQEAGYPAGRWRLPTEAEVNFVANLQRLGFIGNLFSGDGWVSNGTAVQIGTNSVSLIRTGNTARCVYDAWYWGEDPEVPVGQYTVKVD